MRYLLFITAMACTPSFGRNTTGNSKNNLDVNQQDDLIAESGLPSLSGLMEEDYCEGVQPGVAGATSYFMGTYILGGDGWFGREQWILHPTSEWIATDGETCYVTWETVANQGEPAGCPNCDLSLEVSANINRQETDCPEGLWEHEEQWSTTYNVLIDDTSSIFYYQESGNHLGEGHSNDTAINFLTPASCAWF